MLQIGQGVLGKARFVDGSYPQYPRTYLVVSVDTDKIGVLNVSSTAGKEHKLLFPANRSIIKYNPPFVKDSFVKLDSLTYITISEAGSFRALHNGDCLDGVELQAIISAIVL